MQWTSRWHFELRKPWPFTAAYRWLKKPAADVRRMRLRCMNPAHWPAAWAYLRCSRTNSLFANDLILRSKGWASRTITHNYFRRRGRGGMGFGFKRLGRQIKSDYWRTFSGM